MLGVVACETLYDEIERLAPDAAVRYVPQSLHESPLSVADETAMVEAVQARIDDLDGPEMDRIVVVYANGHGELAGVESTHVPLVVSRADDCVSLFTHRTEPQTMGEPKAAGAFYLTRGSIDRGVDAYKLRAGLLGGSTALRERFEDAAATSPDLRVTWPEDDSFREMVERRQGMAPEQVERFLHEVLGYYDRVALVDTGDLYDLHEWYAGEFAGFVERLSAEYGDGHPVEWEVVDGDLGLLRTLLSVADAADVADETDGADEASLAFVPPGTPVRG